MNESNLLRQTQVVTSFGPGSMIDLPSHSIIVGGLNLWTTAGLQRITEPRLTAILRAALNVPQLELYAPPAVDGAETRGGKTQITRFIRGRIFPTWFVTQEPAAGGGGVHKRRRLVRWILLQKGRYRDPEDGIAKSVVPLRFVCACPKGHIDDGDWRVYVHREKTDCQRTLWIEERGTSGDVADVVVGCDCGKERPLYEALKRETLALGYCNGKRPWLGAFASEKCNLPNQLLVRTASNAYFPQIMSVISLPDRDEGLAAKIEELWDVLQEVKSIDDLRNVKKFAPKARAALDGENEADVVAAIEAKRTGGPAGAEVAVKQAEFDVLASGRPRMGRDAPDSPFFAETLARDEWDPQRHPMLAPVERVLLIHRLREVIALAGFTRFDAPAPDEKGELDMAVERASLDLETKWLPAVEHRGEGVFVQLNRASLEQWLARPGVHSRAQQLQAGFDGWKADRQRTSRLFPGAPYVMVHSLSHLLLTAISLDCGYPASSLRERVYAFDGRYGILIHTGSSDAEGTLGGLVEAGRRMARHFETAAELAELCSYDPVCAAHLPHDPNERRFLHGAACHGCLLISETSCEQRNDFLDRALVFPTVAVQDAACFTP